MKALRDDGLSGARLNRAYYIDWLRVIAVLLLVPFHTARIFDIWEPFYAKNDQVSGALSFVVIGAVGSWHMPLFFLLAGASTWHALRFRSAGQYLRERFRRLVIPLVFGVLVLVPPQSYLGALTYGNFSGSFLRYYPHFFEIGPTADLTGYMGGFTPAHLWFILFLFVMALLALPLFLCLRREEGRRLVGRLATALSHPYRVFLLVVPLMLTAALPGISGKNPLYYLTLFIYGYVLVADARFAEILDRHKTLALVLGLSLLVVALVTWRSGVALPGWLDFVVDGSYSTFVTWFLLIAILGFGRRCLGFASRALRYATEAAYPFYVLHQTVIVVIGFWVVKWDLFVPVKFAIVALASTIMTVLVYELLVKRIPVTRFLLGMKPMLADRPNAPVRRREATKGG